MAVLRGTPTRQSRNPGQTKLRPEAHPIDGEPLAAARTILVFGPEPHRCGELVRAFQRRGLPSIQATTPEEAMYWIEQESPALGVLDFRVQGWRPILAHLRSDGRAIIALTDDARDRRMALEAGCIDATSVKVDAAELALKVRGLVRERRVVSAFRGSAGPLEVDLVEGRLRWHGEEIAVPRQVLILAAVLIAHAGHPVATSTLLQELWQDPWSQPGRLHKTVWRLRRAVGLARDSGFLRARRGYGYGIFPDQVAIDPPLPLKRAVDETPTVEPPMTGTDLGARSRSHQRMKKPADFVVRRG